MSDLISRADAINAIEDMPAVYGGWSNSYEKPFIIETLEEVPSAQPKQGEWEHIWNAPDGTYKGRCNQCGFMHLFIDGHDAQYDFCPNCGARMT